MFETRWTLLNLLPGKLGFMKVVLFIVELLLFCIFSEAFARSSMHNLCFILICAAYWLSGKPTDTVDIPR